MLAAILRFWHLTVPDLITDDSLNSFRAVGWFDYLSSPSQTTPIQWFGHIPFWANFSFHDGPPLVFAIQKFFFFIFGDNTLAARLPFTLFGLATVYLVYLLATELRNRTVGLLAAFLISILSFHVWISHIGYLEGIEIFFITLTLWLLIKFINTKQRKFLYFLGISLGLTILTKYTALFLLPAILVYWLIFDRGIYKTKEFWLAGLLFILILSPVIFYNCMVFTTRGHFDAALSSMLGLKFDDFKSVASRAATGNPLNNFFALGQSLFSLVSWPLLVSGLASMLLLGGRRLLKINQGQKNDILILLAAVFCLIFLTFGNLSGERFLSIFTPFLAIIVALVSFDVINFFQHKNWLYGKIASVTLLVVVLSWELFYSINSHLLLRPMSTSALVYSSAVPKLSDSLGLNQLDQYLRQEVLPVNLTFQRPKNLDVISETVSKNLAETKTFYFFDEAIQWFAYNWYFGRYQIYYGLPMGSLYGAVKSAEGNDVIGMMHAMGVETFYFIYPVTDVLLDPVKAGGDQRKISIEFAASLEAQGIKPVEIKNYFDEVAFKVYKFN